MFIGRATTALTALAVTAILVASCGTTVKDSVTEPSSKPKPSHAAATESVRVVPGSPSVIASEGASASNGGMTTFLEWVLEGFSEEIGSHLGGWAIGALFGTGGDKGQLDSISNQLTAIQGQLTQIQNSIDALANQQAFNACAGQTTSAAVGIATIETQLQKYQNLLVSKETDPGRLIAWANDVAGAAKSDPKGGESVQWAVNQIESVLTGLASTTGSIGACAKALQATWTVPLAESDYYVAVYQYLGYFYNWQTIALNLLAEANHVLAAQASAGSGPLPPATDIQKVCTNTNGPQPKTYCNQALQLGNLVYDNIWYQATKAGAAYAWSTAADGGWAQAVQKGTSLLWTTDLNYYGDTSKCNKPLSSTAAACGPTVGTDGPLSVTEHAGLSGWQVASFSNWRDLLNTPKNGGPTPATIMENVGFPTANNQAKMIIYTGQYVPSSKSYPEMSWPSQAAKHDPYGPATDPPMQPINGSASGMCMFDTAMATTNDKTPWPYCRGGQWFWNLANVTSYNPKVKSREYYSFLESGSTSTSSNPSFYTTDLYGQWNNTGTAAIYFPVSVKTKPGWMSVPGNGATPQYRWPVLDVDSTAITCSKLRIGDSDVMLTRAAAGGNYTMCGKDFEAWTKTWLPDPPASYKPSPFHP